MSFLMYSTGPLHKGLRREEQSLLCVYIAIFIKKKKKQQLSNFSISVIWFSFVADKKMMASASTAGNQQLYSQGSPFQPGHSGKTFRYRSPDPEHISWWLGGGCSLSMLWKLNWPMLKGLSLHLWTFLCVYFTPTCCFSIWARLTSWEDLDLC